MKESCGHIGIFIEFLDVQIVAPLRSNQVQNYKFILYAQVKENAQSIVFTIRQIILLFRQIFQGLNHASVWRNDHIERYSEHLTVSTDIVVSEFDSMAKY